MCSGAINIPEPKSSPLRRRHVPETDAMPVQYSSTPKFSSLEHLMKDTNRSRKSSRNSSRRCLKIGKSDKCVVITKENPVNCASGSSGNSMFEHHLLLTEGGKLFEYEKDGAKLKTTSQPETKHAIPRSDNDDNVDEFTI